MKVTIKLSPEQYNKFIQKALEMDRNIPDTILTLALAKLKPNPAIAKIRKLINDLPASDK